MHTREIKIATATTRLAKLWNNQHTTWTDLIQHLQNPHISHTTTAQYHSLSKAKQGDIKDVGGFVGGHLANGRRKKGNILTRSIITLDLDQPPINLLDDLPTTLPCEWVVYSTHSHTPANPRLRLILPLTRDVTPDEYTAVARRIAQDVGIDYFDDTTYEPHRLMYWPAHCIDGEYIYHHNPGAWLDPDKTLARYTNWRDITTWPTSSRQHTLVDRQVERQANPLTKPGLVGAFCRTYTIHQAIETFLPKVYTPTDTPGRYTYAQGESAKGLVVYDNGIFAYSHHSTDPASGQTCNSFDLVRIHLFGGEDDEAKPGTPTPKMPSYLAMLDMVKDHPGVKQALAQERLAQAQLEFGDQLETTTEGDDWEQQLELNQKGKPVDQLHNYVTICTHDPNLHGIAYNEHTSNIHVKTGHPLPWVQTTPGWSDTDHAQLRTYLQKRFGLYSPSKTKDAVTVAAANRKYHPVRDYLEGLPAWDGVQRVDDLLTTYLGADSSEYVRAVTRKTLIAAVARVLTPGVKFDHVLILNGPQGVGKSTIFAKLAGAWFSDALTLTDMRDKTGAEKLQGYWILELGELAGMRKMDIETVKAFITTIDDKYRPAYGTVVASHPRQCIIVGSTNAEDGFLRDATGNRRFWPVAVTGGGEKHAWDMAPGVIDQIWAEALHYYRQGETLYLTGDLAQEAVRQQKAAVEKDERTGRVEAWLNTPVPVDWDERDLAARRAWYSGVTDFGESVELIETRLRDRVCNAEIWVECLGQDIARLKPADSYALAGIMSGIEGWEKTKARTRVTGYGLQRVYSRVESEQPPF